MGELQSLIRFLTVKPWAHYYCKNCPCSTLDYKFDAEGRFCEICGEQSRLCCSDTVQWVFYQARNTLTQLDLLFFGCGCALQATPPYGTTTSCSATC